MTDGARRSSRSRAEKASTTSTKRKVEKSAAPATSETATDGTPSRYETQLDILRREKTEKFNEHIAWLEDRAERLPHPTRLDRESREEWMERMIARGDAAREEAERRRRENPVILERLAAQHAHPGQAELLIQDAREIAEKAATIAYARLTEPQTEKLEVILRKLRKFLQEEIEGVNTMTMRRINEAYRIIDDAVTTSAWLMKLGDPPEKTRELWVRNVAFLWNQRTGQPCTASRNMLTGGKTLNNPPLVRFVRATLEEPLPGLTDGEILRGVKIAQKLVERGVRRWF